MLKDLFSGLVSIFLTLIVSNMLTELVLNKVSIQEELFFIINYRLQIWILHIQAYILTGFHYGITTI